MVTIISTSTGNTNGHATFVTFSTSATTSTLRAPLSPSTLHTSVTRCVVTGQQSNSNSNSKQAAISKQANSNNDTKTQSCQQRNSDNQQTAAVAAHTCTPCTTNTITDTVLEFSF